MDIKTKISKLEEHYDWFEIAELLDMHYNQIREISEN